MAEQAIVVENIKRNFREKTVLDGLSFEVKQGDRVALLGSNGSGKTTLLRILSTITHPTSGRALINGNDVLQKPERVRKIIGFVPATEGGFLRRLTGYENLRFFAALNRLDDKALDQKISQLQLIPLKEALKTPFYLCSSGMKQALLFCRALLHDPGILLLDEPTRSLDQDAASLLHEFLNNLPHTKTVVIASHSASEIESVATRKILLSGGKLSL